MLLRALLVLFIATPLLAASPDDVLIQFGTEDFASGMHWIGPQLPDLQILRDGRIRFLRDGAYHRGELDMATLRTLERSLARNSLLRESRYLADARGRGIGLHGGAWWLHYNSGAQDVVLVAPVIPTSGGPRRLVTQLEELIPSAYEAFIPKQLVLHVSRDRYPYEPVPWPFTEQLSLARAADDLVEQSLGELKFMNPRPVEVRDGRIILFMTSHRGYARVTEGTDAYLLLITGAPDWMISDDVLMQLNVQVPSR